METPWFMAFEPFTGRERLLLLVWLPMFSFNILGEELLWRGYIQTRLERGSHSWLWISLFWLLFHAPFGLDLLVMLLPIIFILPYAFSQDEKHPRGHPDSRPVQRPHIYPGRPGRHPMILCKGVGSCPKYL